MAVVHAAGRGAAGGQRGTAVVLGRALVPAKEEGRKRRSGKKRGEKKGRGAAVWPGLGADHRAGHTLTAPSSDANVGIQREPGGEKRYVLSSVLAPSLTSGGVAIVTRYYWHGAKTIWSHLASHCLPID